MEVYYLFSSQTPERLVSVRTADRVASMHNYELFTLRGRTTKFERYLFVVLWNSLDGPAFSGDGICLLK